MASHFSAIGFPVSTQEEFEAVILRARDNGYKVPSRQGWYKVWTIEESIMLWVGCHRQSGLGINPHFCGSGQMRVRITDVIPSKEYPLDGSIKGWADPDPEYVDSGAYPFMVDLPDFDAVRRDLRNHSIVTVQVAAFAHELSCYDTDEAFSDSQGELKFAPESFIPSGLFSEDEQGSQPSATAFFAGHVERVVLMTNPETKASFYHLVVRTLGGTVDIVADPESVQGQPTVGGVVRGTFWLSGRIKQENPGRTGILQRFFGWSR